MTMPAHGNPGQELLQAFLQTDYVVDPDAQSLVVRIGRRHPDLDRRLGNRSWVILTACNPQARPASPDDNVRHHLELRRAAEAAGLDTVPTLNRSRADSWPDEPSLLLAGLASDDAVGLARQFDQLALVAGNPDRIAELWLVDGRWPARLPAAVRSLVT